MYLFIKISVNIKSFTIKLSIEFFLEIDKLILKFKWKNKEAKTRKNIKKKKKGERERGQWRSSLTRCYDTKQQQETQRIYFNSQKTNFSVFFLMPKLSDLSSKNPLQVSVSF